MTHRLVQQQHNSIEADRELACNSKVRKFSIAIHVQQDVSRLNVTMNLAPFMQVLQALQCVVQYGCYLLLCQLQNNSQPMCTAIFKNKITV